MQRVHPTMEADPIPHRGTDNQDNATGFIWLSPLSRKRDLGEGAEEETNTILL